MPNFQENKHVAVFPFPFSSHPLPVLNLVLKLAHDAPNCWFSFISTEQSNQALFSNTTNTPNNVKHYNVSDGIPEGHVLGSNPVDIVDLFLKTGPKNFQKGIDLAVSETKKPVTCIISDAFVTPTFDVAQALNVPWIPVWMPMPCALSVFLYRDTIRAQCLPESDGSKTLDFLPGLSMIRVEDLPHDVLVKGPEKETLLKRALASLARLLPEAKAVVVSFFEELDPPLFVEDMRSKLQAMLYVPLSTLTPTTPPSDTTDDETGCFSWLDMQKARSVVYVSFGTTVVVPSQHELVALAEALEASGFPFIWSLKDNLKGLLPSEFLERTNMRGKVLPWVPQARLLAHCSVGAFVTHGGCNSLIEGMSSGVPMIFRPFFADQGINARLAEGVWEIGMIIEGGVFSKNGLLKSLNLILVQEEGNKFRENALKVKNILKEAGGPNGRAARDYTTLVELILSS